MPGLIVTQHSGDGKAKQYVLRGFNLDHGTDFATSVNGVPVNMPSHGHGQGYSDLNFLLPELVDRITYRKRPYFAQNGDFASARSADIEYRRRLDAPLAAVTLGQNGFRRGVLGGSVDLAPGLTLLGTVELQADDGPWTVAENLRKRNGVLRVSGGTPAAQPSQRWRMCRRKPWPRSRCSQARSSGAAFISAGNTLPELPTKVLTSSPAAQSRRACGPSCCSQAATCGARSP